MEDEKREGLEREANGGMNQTVKKVMAIWNQFCIENGGRDELNANILWKWPEYLSKEMYGIGCFEEAIKIVLENKLVEVM